MHWRCTFVWISNKMEEGREEEAGRMSAARAPSETKTTATWMARSDLHFCISKKKKHSFDCEEERKRERVVYSMGNRLMHACEVSDCPTATAIRPTTTKHNELEGGERNATIKAHNDENENHFPLTSTENL